MEKACGARRGGFFPGCRNLNGDLTLPDSVQIVGNDAFSECTGLTGTLTLGSSLQTIGAGAFYDCSFSGNLVIPDSVTSIGRYAFYSRPYLRPETQGDADTRQESAHHRRVRVLRKHIYRQSDNSGFCCGNRRKSVLSMRKSERHADARKEPADNRQGGVLLVCVYRQPDDSGGRCGNRRRCIFFSASIQ